jgi:hypothetical protein
MAVVTNPGKFLLLFSLLICDIIAHSNAQDSEFTRTATEIDTDNTVDLTVMMNRLHLQVEKLE